MYGQTGRANSTSGARSLMLSASGGTSDDTGRINGIDAIENVSAVPEKTTKRAGTYAVSSAKVVAS